MNRYLVTGCAGFVGSHLTDSLLEDSHEVVGVDTFTDYYSREQKEANLRAARESTDFELFEVDLAAELPARVLDGVDGVFHLAAQTGVRASWGTAFDAYAWNNLLATQRVFEAAASTGVCVVFASSSSVYGEAESYPTDEETRPRPISPYGVTKLGCEKLAGAYARSFGLDVRVLRYFTVYGPRQRPDMAFSRIVSALLEGTPFVVFGMGEQSRDFTYVDDAVAATRAALLAKPGSVYNVGGGTEATLLDVIAILECLMGQPVGGY